MESRRINEIIPVCYIQELGNENRLVDFTQNFEDFESGDAIGFINEVLQRIFDFYGATNFVKSDAVTQASISIYGKYKKLINLGFFCGWAYTWLNGDMGEKAPTIITLLNSLNKASFDLVGKRKDPYSPRNKARLLEVLHLNKEWLFTEEEKSQAYREKYYAKKVFDGYVPTITQFYLFATYEDGVPAENTWPFLIENFKEWIEISAKLFKHEIKWHPDTTSTISMEDLKKNFSKNN